MESAWNEKMIVECEYCDGDGDVGGRTCPKCDGAGSYSDESSVARKIVKRIL